MPNHCSCVTILRASQTHRVCVFNAHSGIGHYGVSILHIILGQTDMVRAVSVLWCFSDP